MSSFLQNIKDFWKTEYRKFMTKFIYFLVLLSICFYLFDKVKAGTKSSQTLVLMKVMFAFLLLFLMIFISDMLFPEHDYGNSFLGMFIFIVLIIYAGNYYIVKYMKGSFNENFLRSIIFTIFVSLFFILIIYLVYQRKNSYKAQQIYLNFNQAYIKNNSFMYFIVFSVVIFYYIFTSLDFNSKLSNMMTGVVLGSYIMFVSLIFIIYYLIKLKIIKRSQILNTFLALFAIVYFFAYLWLYNLMNSMETICKTKEKEEKSDSKSIYTFLIFASILVLLSLDDTENWHQLGYLFFVLISVYSIYVLMVLTPKYPSLSIIGLWLFVEWCITFNYRGNDSGNSFHYMLMKT